MNIISILFIISSVMPQWVINQGFTIQVYYIFGLLFSFFYTPYFLKEKKVFNSAVNRFFLFLAILLFLRVFSYLGLLIFFSNSSIDFGLMADQYLKSVITNTLNFIVLISLAHFLFSQSLRKRELLFNCFLGVVLAGCIYQFIKFYFLIFHQIFLDNIVWPAISINYSPEPFDYNLLSFGYDLSSASSFISLFRVGGFDINPNVHGAQLACIIPFLIFKIFESKNKWLMFLLVLSIISLVLTMSRSGLLAFGISLIVILFIEKWKIIKKLNIYIIFILITSIITSFYFAEHLFWFYRGGDIFNLSSREPLYRLAFDTISAYPLGIGDNISNLLIMQYPKIVNITGPDLHSFWLMTFVELGIIGGIFYFAYFYFIISVNKSYNNIYSKSLFSAFVGTILASFFNNTFLTFPVQLFIFLAFCLSVSFPRTPQHEKIK